MSSNLTDILAQIQLGNEAALLTLHEQYVGLVYSVAYRVLNDPMAAEEATQDTFMRLWHKAEKYDPEKGSFITWLLTIARRLAIDMHRKQQRDVAQNSIPMDDDIERWENMLGSDDNTDLKRNLVGILQGLPHDQRQAIELAYFQGMSHSQIAEYLGQPTGTIKTRIRLGMQKLREAWVAEPASNPTQNR